MTIVPFKKFFSLDNIFCFYNNFVLDFCAITFLTFPVLNRKPQYAMFTMFQAIGEISIKDCRKRFDENDEDGKTEI